MLCHCYSVDHCALRFTAFTQICNQCFRPAITYKGAQICLTQAERKTRYHCQRAERFLHQTLSVFLSSSIYLAFLSACLAQQQTFVPANAAAVLRFKGCDATCRGTQIFQLPQVRQPLHLLTCNIKRNCGLLCQCDAFTAFSGNLKRS